MQSIPIARVIVCLNNILTMYENVRIVHVVNYEPTLDFPIIRVASLQYNGTRVVYEKPDMYIINVNNQSLDIHLVFLERREDFNPRAKFVFLGTNIKDNTLRILYYLFIVNVVLINEEDGSIHTYYPFGTGKYPAEHLTLVKVGDVTNCSKKNFFEDKLPAVWHQSTFSSCFFYAPPWFISHTEGISPGVMKYLFANSDVEFLWVEEDLTLYNDWTTHFQTVLMTGKCDSATTYLIENVDFLTPHGFEETYWYVPSPKKLSKWKYVFKIFTANVWTLWVGTPVILSIAWCTTLWFKDGIVDMARFISSAALILRFFLEQPMQLFPEFSSQKIIAVTMIFFTYFMNLFFKSRFAHLLTFNQISEHNTIESFEDIMDKKMDVGIITMALFAYDHNEKAQKYFKTHYSSCFFDEDCLNRTAYQRDMATLMVNRIYLRNKKYLVDKDGNDLVLKLYPSIAGYIANMLLKKGHPMMEYLNKKMHILWDHGFISKVNAKYEIDEKYSQSNFVSGALDIEDIELALGILVLGLLVSSIVFYFELQED